CAVNASAAPSSAARDQTHPFRAPSTCRVSSPSNARRSSPVSHGVLSGSVSSATSAMRSTPPSSSTDRPAQARTLRQRSASFVSSAISASLAASACSTAAITVSVRCVIQTHVSKSWCPCEPSSTRSALSTSCSRWITVGVTLPPLVVVVRCRSGATPRLTRSTPSIHGTCRDRCSCATALRRAAFCAHGRPSSRRRLPRRTPSPTALAWASWLGHRSIDDSPKHVGTHQRRAVVAVAVHRLGLVCGKPALASLPLRQRAACAVEEQRGVEIVVLVHGDDAMREQERSDLGIRLEPRDLGVPLAHGGDEGEHEYFTGPVFVPRCRTVLDCVQVQWLVGTHGSLACMGP